jgi:uncharacterized membrane protein YqaE (UPF0057 family)
VDVLKILFALFIPPVAAFMQVGLTAHFWINLVLSLFMILPGSVHALWLIMTKETG